MSPLTILLVSIAYWAQTSNAICPCMQGLMGVDLSSLALKPVGSSSPISITAPVPGAFTVPLTTVSNNNPIATTITASNVLPGGNIGPRYAYGNPGVVTAGVPNIGSANQAIAGYGLSNPRLGSLANPGLNGYALANSGLNLNGLTNPGLNGYGLPGPGFNGYGITNSGLGLSGLGNLGGLLRGSGALGLGLNGLNGLNGYGGLSVL